jgi:hypothetical protein
MKKQDGASISASRCQLICRNHWHGEECYMLMTDHLGLLSNMKSFLSFVTLVASSIMVYWDVVSMKLDRRRGDGSKKGGSEPLQYGSWLRVNFQPQRGPRQEGRFGRNLNGKETWGNPQSKEPSSQSFSDGQMSPSVVGGGVEEDGGEFPAGDSCSPLTLQDLGHAQYTRVGIAEEDMAINGKRKACVTEAKQLRKDLLPKEGIDQLQAKSAGFLNQRKVGLMERRK